MSQDEPADETYNPWTIVNVVFHHLVEDGCHPTFGAAGHPGEHASALLRSLGIVPTVGANARTSQYVRDHLAEMRATIMDQS